MKKYILEDGKLSNLAILAIQEKERKRISQDYHDITLQNLANLIHHIELCQLVLPKDPIRANLELVSISTKLKGIIEDGRNIIFNLRPMSFDDLGFEETLKNIVIKLEEEKTIKINMDINNLPDEWKEDDSIILVTLYRIIYECLMNAVNHSSAEKINIVTDIKNDKYHIKISDNGKGFNVDEILSLSNKHFGLSILEERIKLLGGKLVINSVINKGTDINIELNI